MLFRTFYRLQVYRGSEMMTDSGNIEDNTHLGGRLGVFGFSQAKIIWSNMRHKCSGNKWLICLVNVKFWTSFEFLN